MLEFLPPRLLDALRHINMNFLYELRIRADKPLSLNHRGEFVYLGEKGKTESASGAIFPT